VKGCDGLFIDVCSRLSKIRTYMKKLVPGVPLPVFAWCCAVMITPLAVMSQPDMGKSYINVTKGVNGGTVEPGDTLEIRASFVVKSGFYDSCAYADVVPVGTLYIPGTIRILTNEGILYKQFTDALNDDCGWLNGSNVRINLGFNAADAPATFNRRGRVRNTHKPSFYGSTCIMVCSYRVRVIAALGSIINTGGGSFSWRTGGSTNVTALPVNNIMVFTNYGICANTVGANSIGTEFNGTFGSGKPRNRGTSPNVPPGYTYATFTTGGPQDYYYGIANNTSTQTAYTTSNAWPVPDGASPSHRVFGVWDIIGDHTGAVSPLLGNPAADTVANSNAGYMLVVNAAYRIDSAFKQTITGLCPNTYYEISLWMRNICPHCGCDSNGTGASSSGYIPPAGATTDSSGVHPNITFALDGIDYYTTGNLLYTNQWVKKGFTFVTGPAQTSFSMSLKNNAPGGGGNDWAIDDITVATCTPNLTMQPSPTVHACYGNSVDISSLISCFSPNYIYWQWERSTDGGVSWTSTGVSGTGTPVQSGANWQYTAAYPTFLADSSQQFNIYRIKIASTPGNLLDPNCSFTATSTITVYVNNCSFVLAAKLLSFDAANQNGHGQLSWTTTGETLATQYEVERSVDAVHFTKIATVSATRQDGAYSYTDPMALQGVTYYRVKLTEAGNYKYTRIASLNAAQAQFEIKALVNPFSSSISFAAVTPGDKQVVISVLDCYGRVLKTTGRYLYSGYNTVEIKGLGLLSKGMYILRIEADGQVINKQVVKADR